MRAVDRLLITNSRGDESETFTIFWSDVQAHVIVGEDAAPSTATTRC
jgi:hypothetical protein